MHITDAWPLDTLTIDSTVATAVQHYLLEPFANESEARQFWNDTATQFIYIAATDTAGTLGKLCQPLRQRIAHSLNYPEHSFTLLPPYELSLSILSDDGAGVYLLRHRDNGLVAGLEGGLG
mgnify:CR=1 FL=1